MMGSASKRRRNVQIEKSGRSVGNPGTYTNVVTNQEIQDEEDEKMEFIMDAVTAVLCYRNVVKAEDVAKLFSVPLVVIENILWHYNLWEVRPGLWTWKDTETMERRE